jgi:hypothetical protein
MKGIYKLASQGSREAKPATIESAIDALSDSPGNRTDILFLCDMTIEAVGCDCFQEFDR